MLRFCLPVALAALLLSGQAHAADFVAVPPLKARVTDLTGSLNAEQQADLERTLREFESQKGSQIAVLILPSTKPEEIEQYGIRVAEQWKLGRKKIDDGLILIVAKDDHRVRIEVGYGLEGLLNDLQTANIRTQIMNPAFKNGDYAGSCMPFGWMVSTFRNSRSEVNDLPVIVSVLDT